MVRRWQRVGGSKRTTRARGIISAIVAATGVLGIVLASQSETDGWAKYIWPAVSIFIAWRFFFLGLYTSEEGVTICNPVFTWTYPWGRVDHFELAGTGEMFAPKAKGITLVTTDGKKRMSWDLTTSGLLTRLSPADQAELLEELNQLAQTKGTA